MKIKYSNIENCYIPDLTVPLQRKHIGFFGRMRAKYLKNHHRAIYSLMMIKGTFLDHLAEIDEVCHEEMQIRIEKMAKAQGVTEELKSRDGMHWTGIMNNIKNAVCESVLREFVYTEEGMK